jgi:hypothetical protein
LWLIALTSCLAVSLLYFGGVIHPATRRKQSDETWNAAFYEDAAAKPTDDYLGSLKLRAGLNA